jgi:hypothetical protein
MILFHLTVFFRQIQKNIAPIKTSRTADNATVMVLKSNKTKKQYSGYASTGNAFSGRRLHR